eukprot:PITA_13945
MSRHGDKCLSRNSFNGLQRRELNGKLPNSFWDANSFWDYHVHVFYIDERVTHLVIADDIICVSCNGHLIPFGRQGKVWPLKDEYGKPITLNCQMEIVSAYYNSNNNSLIIVGYHQSLPYLKIISMEVASVKAGRTDEYRDIYAEEADAVTWDFDIPNCRGVIYNKDERVFKVFDLKEYNQICTISLERGIPVERKIEWFFQSRGNMYVVIYFDGGFPRNTSDVSFKIYSKRDGELCQEGIIHLNHHEARLQFAALCGDDRICLQQHGWNMQVIDISEVEAFTCVICGDILITFEDHPIRLPVFDKFQRGTYIANEKDMIISFCDAVRLFEKCTINISSIITGECLAKITNEPRSQIRELALSREIVALAYDERIGEIFTANEDGICCVWSKNFPSDAWMEYEDE